MRVNKIKKAYMKGRDIDEQIQALSQNMTVEEQPATKQAPIDFLPIQCNGLICE